MTIPQEKLVVIYDCSHEDNDCTKATDPATGEAAEGDAYVDPQIKDRDFIQQTFLGASIMDFSVSLGLNSAASTLSLRLVEDDLNYGTEVRKYLLRDAVSEGYHPWNRNAFPEGLVFNTELNHIIGQDDDGNDIGYPNYGVLPIGELPDGDNFNVGLNVKGAKGDIFFPPKTGDPVFFKYYLPKDLKEDCVKEETESSRKVFNVQTYGVCQTTKDDTTEMTQEVKDQNGNSPSNEEDCAEAGGTWDGSKCNTSLTKDECEEKDGHWVEKSRTLGCDGAFEFNGIFKKYERTYGTSGAIYNIEVTDPRTLLENTTVILKDVGHRTAPADAWVTPDSLRKRERGFKGQSNVLNVFGYYESVNLGNSAVNDAGFVWYDHKRKLKKENGQELINPYRSKNAGWGILSALDTMLNNHYWSEFDNDELSPSDVALVSSGMETFGGDGLFSEYVANGEPFGGPLYYGHDDRANTDPAPLAKRSRNPYMLKYGSRNHIHIHRYKVDLTDLAELSIDKNPGVCIDSAGNEMDPPEHSGFYKDRPIQWRCENGGGLWQDAGTLPFDFRVNADKISLLSLIEQVCTSAGADFFVSLERPDRNVKKEENFSGIIKITPIFRSRSLVNPVQSSDIITKFEQKNYLSAAIDLALDKEKPLGPFTRPLFEKGHSKYDKDQRQSILSSASLGYEFGDPKTGVVLYGAKRTRMVGVTHLGDRGFDPYYNYSSFFRPYNVTDPNSLTTGGFPATDLAYEYLPSTEVDGVTLRHQTLNRLVASNGKVDVYRDEFYEMENEKTEQEPAWVDGVKTMVDVTYKGYTWNDYGDEYESVGSCSDDQYDTKADCEENSATWKEESYLLSNVQSLFKDYQRSGAHYSNDNYLPFYHWKDFQLGSVSVEGENSDDNESTEDKTFLPEQLNRINSKFVRDRVKAAGSCQVSSFQDGDETVDLDTQETCELYGLCGEDNDVPMIEADCDAIEGEHEWTQLKWTPQNGSARSGYLDIYPCWGFEQKVLEHGTYSNAFDDIIDIKVEQEPIKGMYWDDDPYRDFHPSEGIFSVFEFYNPGLGQCIRVSCNENANADKCFSNEGDEIENIPAGDDAPATEETCTAAGTCQVIGGTEDGNDEANSSGHNTKEECLAQKNGDGTPKNEWISTNKWVKDGDVIDAIFTDETAAIKVCETYGGENNTVFETFENKEKLCTCDPLSPFRGGDFAYTDTAYLMGVANECQTGWRDADPSLFDGGDDGEQFLTFSGTDPETVVVKDVKAFVPNFKWESFCTINSTCTASDGSEVKELHTNELGTGNEIHKQKGGCEKACFEKGICIDGNQNILDEFTEEDPCRNAGHVWQNPNNNEGPIVAYFLVDYDKEGDADQQKRGMSASKDKTPEAFKGSFSTGNNGTVQLVLDETTCISSLASANSSRLKGYQYIPIDSSGEIAAEGEENKFSSIGGPYSAKCDAMSIHSPYYEQCLHTEGEFEGLPTEYQKVDECLEAKLNGEKVDWKLNDTEFPVKDHYYGKVVEAADHPEPGYIVPRYRITKGNCITEVQVQEGEEGEEGETTEQTTIAEIDDTFRPKTRRDPNYSIPQDCYKASSGKAKIDYSEVDQALKHLWQPRTATIPIRIEGYGGSSSPTANEIGGETNQFEENIRLNGSDYYMATVTELRHAAISFESWKSYLRAFAPHLPCYMYAKNPFFSSVWSGLCPVIHKEVKMGIGRASVDALRSVASGLSRGLPEMTFTEAQNHLVSKKGDAEKLSGAVKKEKGELTDYEESKMQLDMAYKAVRDVATNFYGRKFLVPLPVIPPKENFCSGYSAKEDQDDPHFSKNILTKDVRYDNQEDCEAAGFEWGAHPDLSKMLNSSKTTEDKNNWEIVNSAWPGGEVNLKNDDNGSYPTNLNFWNDDGNLRAFAVFPEKITNRMNEQTQDVGFNNYDPEKIQMTNYKILEDFENIDDLEIKKLADAFGGKVYVEIDVDPKIYWLHDRSYAERVLGQQYFMHETGNVTLQTSPGEKRELHAYAEIGTETAKTVVDDRSIWTFHDLNDPETGKAVGQCFDSEGKVLPEEDPPLTKDTCEQTEGNKWTAADSMFQLDVGESGPKRPYALITLPEKIFYQENDRVKKSKDPSTAETEPAFKLGFEVPLSETKNSKDLFLAWTFQQIDDNSVALRNVERNLNKRVMIPTGGIDVSRASMIAAAMKPWHASIPQESNLYRWGPWVTDFGFGRTEFDIDTSYHPAAFGGEKILYKAASDHIYATKENHIRKSFESGSVTLASGPEHKLGSQAKFDFPTEVNGQVINFDHTLGAYVTDIAVDVGENGISTRYGFNSQSRFGDLQAIYEERLRKSQKDMIRNLKKQEEDQRRTKRNIKEFKD